MHHPIDCGFFHIVDRHDYPRMHAIQRDMDADSAP